MDRKPIVGFGSKYRGWSFEEVYDADAAYCTKMLTNTANGNIDEFRKYVTERRQQETSVVNKTNTQYMANKEINKSDTIINNIIRDDNKVNPTIIVVNTQSPANDTKVTSSYIISNNKSSQLDPMKQLLELENNAKVMKEKIKENNVGQIRELKNEINSIVDRLSLINMKLSQVLESLN
jgi:hypothetical protein